MLVLHSRLQRQFFTDMSFEKNSLSERIWNSEPPTVTFVFSFLTDTQSSKLLACQKAIKTHLSLDQNQIHILAVKKGFAGLNNCTI